MCHIYSHYNDIDPNIHYTYNVFRNREYRAIRVM